MVFRSTREELYEGGTTRYVILASIIAATGGLTFGFDIGISGGVASMDSFLYEFFPEVLRHKKKAKDGNYCMYANHRLSAFTSSLYISGLLASFLASYVTRRYGRKPSIIFGGLSFLVGSILNGTAKNLLMLYLGRIVLGIGVGFGNQAVPLYISEMAPPKSRGALNICFQLAVTVGNLSAQLINYGTSKITHWGWKLSLGLGVVPAILMTLGGCILPETPSSLVERKHYDKGKEVLEKIRGTYEVDAEFEDIKDASVQALAVGNSFKHIIERRNRPQLFMAILIPTFVQLTGINIIMFYAPVLLRTVGFGSHAALYSAVAAGTVNVIATIVSIVTVDRFGRRVLLLVAGFFMLIAQVFLGGLLGAKLGDNNQLSRPLAITVLVIICFYVANYAWSWGPLGWLIPSEIFPLETRSAGQAITVAVNLFCTFVIAQLFLISLCYMKFGIFFFFSVWLLIMSVCVYSFLPETKNIPIEEMMDAWRSHWFWRWIVPAEDHLPPMKRLEV